MNIKLLCLINLLILFNSAFLFSTVDFLCINHITKELHVFEDDEYVGLGWAARNPNDNYYEIEKEFLEKGYRYTNFVYKIEAVLGIILILSLSITFIFFKIKK